MKIFNNLEPFYNYSVIKVKPVLLILFLFASVARSYGQEDSVMSKLINSGMSKPEIIKKGTDEILRSMGDGDILRAGKIKDFMLTKVEDSVYAAFDLHNYRLLLYWMHDYEELIDLFLHFDSLSNAKKHKIKPNDSGLYLNLAWSLPEAAKNMFRDINKSDLSDDSKEVLILDLHKRAMEVDGGDYYMKDYSKRVSQFNRNYPKSPLKDYVRKHIGRLDSWDEE